MLVIATIKDVAREAGVSISTVSFAINGTAPVAAETKKRIFEVIERLNYKPNSIARGLVTQKSHNIGLYVPSFNSDLFLYSENNLFLHLLQGIGEIVDLHNYNLLLSWNSSQADNTDKIVELARSRTIDGLLLITPYENPELIESLIGMQIPFVFLGTYLDQRHKISFVDVDNRQAACDMTSYLIRQGHRRIAFIPPDQMRHFVSQTRYQGYVQAMKEAGLPTPPHYLQEATHDPAAGYAAAEAFFRLAEPPTAIVAGRDSAAIGVLQFAEATGLKLPEDLAVVSFENSKLAEDCQLTSASTDLHAIGKQGAKLLFELMQQKAHSAAPAKQILLPSKIVFRASSEPV